MMPPVNCMNQCLELISDYITSLGLKICTMLRCSVLQVVAPTYGWVLVCSAYRKQQQESPARHPFLP
jgi:hypothetical protein